LSLVEQKFVCPTADDPDLPHDGAIKHGGCWCRGCRRAYQRAYQTWLDPDYGTRRESARRAKVMYGKRPWTCEEDALLGTNTDRAIGQLIDRNETTVHGRREKLGIAPFRKIRATRVKGYLGYVAVALRPDDPFFAMARGDGSVLEHRLVLAEHLGRPLTMDEFVHHKNGDRKDNRLDNLELWTRSHPDGQRVEDVFGWCVDFIERYAKEQG
jgi:hypothetical protein